MKLSLLRTSRENNCVFGEMSIDDEFTCYTLERPAVLIPAGTYPLTYYFSPHNNMTVPLLHNVPGRTMIEIHAGNTPSDTEGCILVGRVKKSESIEESRIALAELMAQIDPLCKEISIIDPDQE
jgi:hypothetical protein